MLSCTQAAAVAESAAGIPSGLLLAIGRVESGRADATGKTVPWPWTIDVGGAGRFFRNRNEAVAAVQQRQSAGDQSIDIGCFQVNLMFHPDAFPDLAAGFDPLTNALAAAHFLASLHAELGSWERAVASYHSRTAALGGPYRDQVLATWHGKPMARMIDAGWGGFGVRVWWPGARGAQPGLPHVITP